MNENGEASLGDIIRIWIKDTFPHFTIVKETFSSLNMTSPIHGLSWATLKIDINSGLKTTSLQITAERYDDDDILYHHLYKINDDNIEDTLDRENKNYAYNKDFISKLKQEIEDAVKGKWWHNHLTKTND